MQISPIRELVAWLRLESRQPLMFCLKFFGFVIGFVGVLLLLAYINFESSYDSWNTDAARVVRAVEVRDVSTDSMSVSLPYPFADAARADLGEVQETLRMQPLRVMLQRGQDKYNETVFFAEPSVLSMFQVKLIGTSGGGVLDRPFSLVISQRAAEKYFGSDDPVGKTLSLGNERDLTVTAVMRDWPANSHLAPDFLVPIESFFQIVTEKAEIKRERVTGWTNCHCYATYLKLKEGATAATLNGRMKALLVKHQGAEYAAENPVFLQPLAEVYLGSQPYATTLEHARKGDAVQLAIMLAMAAVLLLTAAVNFANFSLAQATLRAKEVAVRRVLGATSGAIVLRLTLEAFVLCMCALLASFAIAAVLVGPLGAYLDRPLDATLLLHPPVLVQMFGAALLVTAVAAAFAALTLARAGLVDLLRSGAGGKLLSAGRLRLAMVLTQFIVSSGLIIGAAGIHGQIVYVRDLPKGYVSQDKLVLAAEGSFSGYGELMAKLRALDGVTSVAIANTLPTTPMGSQRQLVRQGSPADDYRTVAVNEADVTMLKSLGVTMLAGRMLGGEFGADRFLLPEPGTANTSFNVVLNESASTTLGFASAQQALGQVLVYADDAEAGYSMNVVGVHADIRYGNPREQVVPMLYLARDDWHVNRHEMRQILLAVREPEDAGLRERITAVWDSQVPAFVGDLRSMPEALQAQMRGEERQFHMVGAFAAAAVLVSLFGVLGLASFMMRRRAKELAIRQVLGATHGQIAWLVTSAQLRVVAAAAVLSYPLVYFGLVRWLDGFAVRTPISPLWFIGGTVLNVTLALLVVFIFSLRIAARSPVEYLRGD